MDADEREKMLNIMFALDNWIVGNLLPMKTADSVAVGLIFGRVVFTFGRP